MPDLPIGGPLDPEDDEEDKTFERKYYRRLGNLDVPQLTREAADVSARSAENRFATGGYLDHPNLPIEDRREMTGPESDLRQQFLKSRGLEPEPVPLDPQLEYSPLARGLGSADLPYAHMFTPNTPYEAKKDDINWSTPLSPEEEKGYQAWARKSGRNAADDEHDYDLRGFYKDVVQGNPDLPTRLRPTIDQWRANLKPDGTLKSGHLPDLYKKPNHPTFSDESIYNKFPGSLGPKNQGGHWDEATKTFTLGPTNLQHWRPQQLQDYFKKYEPGYKVVVPAGYK